LPLADGSFDVVLSSLGMQFVPDKASALREMRRVLAPDGQLAIAAVGPTPPLFAILEQALARHVKPEAAAFMRAVFSLHEPQELETLTSGAGFRHVQVRRRRCRSPFLNQRTCSGNTSTASRWRRRSRRSTTRVAPRWSGMSWPHGSHS
jgi:SAM-dependent methyltransferase